MKKTLKSTLILLGLTLAIGASTQVDASSRSWKSWFIEKYFWLKGDK
ncbi:TPA: esterase, partial [Streptococcus pyogenes]